MRKKLIYISIWIFYFAAILTVSSLVSLTKINYITSIKNAPKMNANEIAINTPENITYPNPMSGYYPATYGFENDVGGSSPNNWTLNEEGGSVDVQNTLDEHNKVLRFSDISTTYGISAWNVFENQTTGIVEWWFKKTSGSTACYFNFHGGTNASIPTRAIEIGIDGDNNGAFGIRDGGPWVYDYSYSDDTWYHLKVEFDCVNHNFTLYKNGAPLFVNASFWAKMDKISLMIIGTNSFRDGVFYTDAIGYSWDPDYNIGDNLNEGLLLSYDIGFTPDWQGYSLDGQANHTILGNTTFPYPVKDGIHTIQVFGNDSGGVMYESNVRYFSIKHINIITPENITYYGSMSGYYPATYGFENDVGGSSPNTWTLNEEGGSVDVQNTLDEHNKVLRFYDTSTTYGISAWNVFENQTTGIVEWWFKKTSGSTACYFNFHGGTNASIPTRAIEIGIDGGDNGAFGVRDGGPWVYDYSYSDDTWYHLKVEFDCVNHNFTLYKNGVPLFVNASFWAKMDEISLMIIGTNSFRDGIFYTDAIGYSWDPDYNIGDNLNEGLLLSYYIGFTPDWQGYSLDGQANHTILGDTTIPLPGEGLHRIQVFGNDSGGVMYESNVRYFTTLYHPEISINSPTHFEFFGYTAPNFNISIIEMNLHSRWYTLDSGATNITFGGFTGQINQTEWDKYGNGTVIIRFYANDTWGLEGYSEVIVRKDTLTPSSSINFTPHSGNDIVNESTTFSLTATDGFGSGVSYIRYKINDSNWIIYTTPFTLSNYPYGDILISYQAVDELDNYEPVQTILVHRTDTIAPSSSILFLPHSGIDVVNESTSFSLIADDDEYGAGVSYIRYKINDSSWITYTTPFTLSNYPYGDVLISYQAVDELGNYESIQTIVVHRTDTITPTSAISFTPYRNTDIVIRSTNFTITANDDEFGSGISNIRYKINDSVWYDYNGPFDLSGYDYGEYVITYQAIDNAGNIEDEHSIMVTLITEPSQPGIPGYHLFIMLSVIGMISAVIIKKKFK